MQNINFPDNVVAVSIIVFGACLVAWLTKPNRKNGNGDSDIKAVIAEMTKAIQLVVDNNTKALQDLQIVVAQQSGKLENILNNTNLILQRDKGERGD